MTKKPVRRYTVDGKRMTPDDLRRLHEYLIEMETIAIISDEMRVVVESEWPELVHKLPRNDDPQGHIDRQASRRLTEGRSRALLKCPTCNGWIDCRDLDQVSEHEGPLPHPAQDQPQ